MEVVDDDGNPSPPGHDGTVVVTNLFNRTMPLIRYVLGDHTAVVDGDVGECRCGTGLMSIRTPAGRSEDFITLPDGQRVSPRILDDLVYDASAARGLDHPFYQSVRDYQAIQDTPHSIRVLYLTDSAIPAFVSEVLKRGFRALHPALTCEARAIETLASAESGKRRRVVSNL